MHHVYHWILYTNVVLKLVERPSMFLTKTIDIKSKSAEKRKVLKTNFKYLEKEQKIHIYFLMIGVLLYEKYTKFFL